MNLTKMTGTISNVQFGDETVGHIGQRGGNIHTKQTVNFRLDGKPVMMKLPNRPDLSDGETVSVVGTEKNGVFKALALRNASTGAVYELPVIPLYIFGVLFTLVGLPLLFILVGVVFIGVGLANLYLGTMHKKAALMVR